MSTLKNLIESLPKAELHLHLEGSLEPEQMFEFARRNGVQIPFDSVDDIREAYRFSNLQDFLDIYYVGMNVLITEQDFFDLTQAYLRRVAKDNVRHVEVFFDPQGHTDRGIPFETVVSGITRALHDVGSQLNISHRLILCFLRHLSEESAFATLSHATPYLHVIHGVGLDSAELGNPPEKFERVFKQAKDLGLKLVAHAGEEGPPEYVEQALDLLNVDRLDHGNRSLESSELVSRLVREQIGLTVCPLSNLKLCVVDELQQHPLKYMLEVGLLATINSDDPAYFGGYVNDNYLSIAQALELSVDDLSTLAKNSFSAAFLSPQEIAGYHREIDDCVAGFGEPAVR